MEREERRRVMARRRVLSVLGTVCVLLGLTACSVAVPDPQANAGDPAATATHVPVQSPAQAVAEDPALSVISGTVASTGGAPLAGAAVTLREGGDRPGCGRCGRLAAAVTGADGAFTLAVPDGVYSLSCSTRGATVCRLSRAADVRQADLLVTGPVSGLRFLAPVARRSHPR
jgi:hypothetical protein